MKNIRYILTAAILATIFGCVDDYTDANPSPRLDAPNLRVSTPGAANNVLVSNPVNAFQSEPEVFMTYGGPLVFTVSVIDAPGKIGEVSVSSSIPEYGTVILDDASVAAAKGSESGDFTFTFTPSSDFDDESDRSFNIDVRVSDTQADKNGRLAPKTTTLTIPVTLANCLSSGISSGYYVVTELSATEDGGTPITLADLEGAIGERVVVRISMDRPGLYSIDEVTGGVWPIYYSGRANPELQVDLCGNTISGHEGAVTTGAGTAAARTFTIDGTLNGDGTVTITWSYVRDDGATPADPASGTYTLTRL